jgi:plastocyanin
MREASLFTRLGAGLVTGCAVLVVATACGGSSQTSGGGTTGEAGPTTTGASVPATEGATLRMSGFSFGNPLTVRPGQKINVVNADGAPHTVTADRGDAFDVSVEGGSSTALTAPTKPGSYPFHCTIHPMMRGSLTVR